MTARRRSSRALAALLATVVLIACGDSGAAPEGSTGDAPVVAFHLEETLYHPTSDGASLVLVPEEDCELRVVAEQGERVQRTPWQRVVAEQPFTVRLEGFEPGREVRYRVASRRGADGPERERPERSFRTLPESGGDLAFAILADPHAWAQWARVRCGDYDLGWKVLEASLDAVAADEELDFALIGTDSVMTRCGRGCSACPVDGEMVAEGSSVSARDAMLRYRTVFGPEMYGRIADRLPLLVQLGDHDGEVGWVDDSCQQTDEQRAWSRAARAAHVPNAHAVYGGDPDGTWHAVRAGALLLVLLDVSHDAKLPPRDAESWTLGEAQWAWLEDTLASSDAPFKVVLAEHMLGGLKSPEGRGSQCWKARNSLKATVDGSLTAPFTGEQQRLHELMREQGVQLFVGFHDHIVTLGEKPGADGATEGVAYLVGGQCADAASEDVRLPGPPWAHEAWYQQAMDYDDDGVPEYLTERTGTLEKGWFKVRVHGEERVEFEYLRASANPLLDGRRVLGFELLPDGPSLPAPR